MVFKLVQQSRHRPICTKNNSKRFSRMQIDLYRLGFRLAIGHHWHRIFRNSKTRHKCQKMRAKTDCVHGCFPKLWVIWWLLLLWGLHWNIMQLLKEFGRVLGLTITITLQTTF